MLTITWGKVSTPAIIDGCKKPRFLKRFRVKLSMIKKNMLNDLKNKIEELDGRNFSLISGVSGETSISVGEDLQSSNTLVTDGYILTLFFPMFPFDPPENIRKPKVF